MQTFNLTIIIINLFLKNKLAILITTIFPILLIFFFSMLDKEASREIYFIDNDNSIYSELLLDIISQDEKYDITVFSQLEFDNLLNTNKVDVIFIIEENFINDREGVVAVTNINTREAIILKQKVLSSILNNTRQLNMIDSSYDTLYNNIKEAVNFDNSDLIARTSTNESVVNLANINWTVQASIGYILMFLFYLALSGAVTIFDDEEDDINKRVMSSVTSYNKYLIAKLIAVIILGTVQILILIFASQFLFNVIWTNDLFLILSIFILYFVCVAILSFVSVFNAGSNLFIITTCLIGGLFFPIEIAPTYIKTTSLFTPQGLSIYMIKDIVLNNTTFVTILPYLIRLIFTCIFSLLIFLFYIKNFNKGDGKI